jgi:cytochrome c553
MKTKKGKNMKVLLAAAALMAATGALASETAKNEKTHAERMERGKQIASTVCVACHGLDGISPIPANPNIAGMPAQYIAKQLAAFKSKERVNPIMEAQVAAMEADDMRSLGVYYFAQKGKTAAIARDRKLAEQGAKIYRAGIADRKVPACAGCHGGAGAGIPANYPRLAGQWPDYTVEELNQYASGARKSTEMQAIASRMTAAERVAVAEFVAGMRSK